MLKQTTTFVRITTHERLRDRTAIIGRIGFYTLIIFIFTQLWNIMLEQHPIDGLNATDFI